MSIVEKILQYQELRKEIIKELQPYADYCFKTDRGITDSCFPDIHSFRVYEVEETVALDVSETYGHSGPDREIFVLPYSYFSGKSWRRKFSKSVDEKRAKEKRQEKLVKKQKLEAKKSDRREQYEALRKEFE